MLASITPLGERGRNATWSITVTAFVIGAIAAGAVGGGVDRRVLRRDPGAHSAGRRRSAHPAPAAGPAPRDGPLALAGPVGRDRDARGEPDRRGGVGRDVILHAHGVRLELPLG